MFTDNTDECAEPENLSTKPQDLSVKLKSTAAAAVAPTVVDVKKEFPSSYQHQLNVAAPASSLSPYYPHHPSYHPQQIQTHHPYHPTAVKPGPLEPLCLNIAAGNEYHANPLAAVASVASLAAATPAYHYHHRHYAPATPRPVPAQYPNTGYLASYMYHNHHHGAPGLTAERAFSAAAVAAAAAAAAYPAPTMVAAVRDPSLSPPGSGGSGSAFKPLHGSPPSAAVAIANSPPAMMTWYGHSVSPPPAQPQPPPLHYPAIGSPVQYGLPQPSPSQLQPSYQTCSGDSDASSAATVDSKAVKRPDNCKPTGPAARYKCDSCPKTYSTVSGLTKHRHFHCSDDDTVAVKTFCCKYCDKAYNTLGALKMHIRTHTLPCICKLCGKAFSRPWLLQGHIRTHTGEKPFSCPHCNRAFADRSNLRAHLQTHSDVKKYSCPTCSKTFSRMSLLTKHCDTGCPRLQTQHQHQQQQ